MALDPKEEAKKTAQIVEDAFRNIAANVQDIFANALDSTDTMGKTLASDITKNLNSIARQTSIFISNNEKIRFGLIKRQDILRQIAMSEAKIIGIQNQMQIADDNGIKGRRARQKQLLEAQEMHHSITAQLQEQVLLIDKQTYKLGITGAIIKGINRVPILKELLDSEYLLAEAIEATNKKGATRLSVFKSGIVSMGKLLIERISDPALLLSIALKGAYEMLKSMDTQATTLARSFAISKESAMEMRNRFNDIATNSNTTLINTQELVNTQAKLNNILGTSVEFDEARLVSLTKAFELLELSEDAQKGLTSLTFQTGKGVNDIQNGILGTSKVLQIQKGIFLNQKQILEETLNTTASLRMQFGNNVKEIAAAVTEAKMLGFNLKDIEGIQSNMLNFESSISAELDAELLTGRELNLERARYFSLTGNIRELTNEINKNGVTALEFEGMNVLQREAFAKSIGLSSDRLAEILLTEQQNLNIQKQLAGNGQLQDYLAKNKLGYSKESLLQAIQSGAVNKDILNSLGEQDRLALSTLEINKRFTRSVERLKDVFSSIIDGPAGKLLIGIDNIMQMIDKSSTLKALAGIGAVAGIGLAIFGISKRFMIGLTPSTAMWVRNAPGSGGGIMSAMGFKNQGAAGKIARAGSKFGVGGAVGMAGKMMGKAFKGNAILATLMGVTDAATNIMSGKSIGESLSRAIITALSSLGGGLLGSLIGPAGTVAGGIIGGIVGDQIGDLILGSPKKMAVGGIVTAPTRAIVGEAGREAVVPLDDFYAKLDQLIDAVGVNRNIYMDGRLVGDAISVRSFK